MSEVALVGRSLTPFPHQRIRRVSTAVSATTQAQSATHRLLLVLQRLLRLRPSVMVSNIKTKKGKSGSGTLYVTRNQARSPGAQPPPAPA